MKSWNDDHYTKKAQKENFVARSVYKLEEIDQKEKILRTADLILDLGASPGSWTQYCLKKRPQAKVIAVDLKPLSFSDSRVHFVLGDIETVDFPSLLNGRKADLVISDMAPNTTGNTSLDCTRSCVLAETALGIALTTLKPSGFFVVKFFMGAEFESYNKQLRVYFSSVNRTRPDSTRKASKEIFFICSGLKPSAARPVS